MGQEEVNGKFHVSNWVLILIIVQCKKCCNKIIKEMCI